MNSLVFCMIRRGWCSTSLAIAMASSTGIASAAPLFSLELLPLNGNISEQAGATSGWGYRLINTSDYYLVPTSLTADIFDAATPWSLFDFPTVVAYSVVERPFIADLTGIFQITWAEDAAVGTTNAGVFAIDALWYNADPLDGGTAIGSAGIATATYSAQVSLPTEIPEPGSIFLVLGTAILAAARYRTQKLQGRAGRDVSIPV